MRVESRPNFEAHRWKGAFFLWRLPAQRSTVAVEVERRYFFIDEPPELFESGGRFFYRITPRAVADVIDGYKFSMTPKQLALSHRVQVTQLEEVSTAGGYEARPKKAHLVLSRLTTELLFRHALHYPPSGVLVTSLLGDLWQRLEGCRPLVDHRVVIRSLGVWVYKITSMFYATYKGIRKATFDLDLVSYEPGSSIASSHPTGGPPPPGSGQGGVSDPVPPFSKGWSWQEHTEVLPDEEAPTIELRWAFECTPIEALLILLLSRGGATSGPYDKMLGRPLALKPSWVKTGAVAGDPLTIDPRTSELAQLNQLISEIIVPQFQAEDTVGGFCRDISLFYLLMFAALSTGEFTWRRWATSGVAGLTAINPTKRSLDVGQLLEPLQAVRLLSGINEGDLSPQYGRTATLGGAKTVEALANAVPVRLWHPGNVLSDEALKSEAFSVFFKALFSVLGGRPRMFEVETSLEDQSFNPGDVCSWTDKRIPTPDGIGFTNVRFLVVGKDVKFLTATATYRLLRDYYNETTTNESRVSPCLIIDQVIKRAASVYTLDVRIVGAPTADLEADFDEFYHELESVNGRLRIVYPLEQNPEATLEEEREGYLEASATLMDVTFLSTMNVNRLVVNVDPSWARGGFTLYDVIRRGARILFTDRREDNLNPEGALIEPHYTQLYAGGAGFDYAKWGNDATFDQAYTLIR